MPPYPTLLLTSIVYWANLYWFGLLNPKIAEATLSQRRVVAFMSCDDEIVAKSAAQFCQATTMFTRTDPNAS